MITIQKIDNSFYIKSFLTDSSDFNRYVEICRKYFLKFDNLKKGYTHTNPKILINVVDELADEFDIFVKESIRKEMDDYNPYIPSFKPRRLKLEKSFFEKFPPKGDYQIEDAYRMASYGRFGNFNKQGTGKTYESIQAINQLFFHKLIDKVLIVVIPVLTYNWKREMLEFSNLFTEEDFLIITEANREKIYEKDLPKVVITSYDTFRLCSDYAYKQENKYKPFSKLTQPIIKYCKENKIDLNKLDPEEKILRLERINKKIYNEKVKNYRKEQLGFSWWGNNRLIILDESHKIKNMSARRSQILHKHKHFFDYRFCLTGTPHPQGVHELYSNIKFIDDCLVDENYIDFLHTLGEVGNEHSKYALASIDEEKANKFLNRIKPYYCRRFLREVVKDLPEVVWKPVYIPFEGIQKQIYQSIINDELTSIKEEKGFIQYKDLIVKFPYMMSVLSDPLLVADKILEFGGLKNWKFEDSLKFKVTESLINSILEDEEKIVIWEEHPNTINRLGKAFEKYNPICIHGQNTPKGREKYEWRDEQINKFKTDKKVKILIANPTTLGTGTNLQFVRSVIYFSRNADFVNWDQSTSRTERIGMIGEVVYYILLIDNSLDIHTDIILKDKETLDRLFLKQGLTTKDCKDIFTGVRI